MCKVQTPSQTPSQKAEQEVPAYPIKPKVTNEEKRKVIQELIKTPEGRAKLAASMVPPVRGMRPRKRRLLQPIIIEK